MDTVVVDPMPERRCPLVIVYMDVWGVREELVDVARRIATCGYRCALPDLYYRQGQVRHAYRDADGRMITLEKLSDEQKETVRSSLRQLSDDMVMSDTAALLETLAPDGDMVGALGYCMGGRHVLRAAGGFPDRIGAIASLHGTNLVMEGSNSPHLNAASGHADIYCGFGELDPFAAPSTREALAETFASKPFAYTATVHAGAHHGYALTDRDVFDKHATNIDWTHIFRMLHRRMPPWGEATPARTRATG